MQPRIDTNLGITGEPDAWVHSACILCSNGCGLEIAVKKAALWASAERPITRSNSAIWARRVSTVGSPTIPNAAVQRGLGAIEFASSVHTRDPTLLTGRSDARA